MTTTTIQFPLGGGATIALPADQVAERLIEQLKKATPKTHAAHPQIGEYLTGQGGIYVGNIRGDDGVTYGLIAAEESDIGKAAWGATGELQLSAWDGLTNTNQLRDSYPAAKLASDYEEDGHVDFYLPARRELQIAAANVPHLFNKDGWYWSSTSRTESYAWAVDFEYGSVNFFNRFNEFRVRPFRRFAL